MTEKDLADMIKAEEKRLKLHSPEFMQRDREIMEAADRIRQENKKRLCQSGDLTEAGNPYIFILKAGGYSVSGGCSIGNL